ncbi:MAG: 50S ribosomal protein L44e, partial [Candidatus Altiarchaeota archaeon]|nr:50S ribosomal protein L44e [Candidatus Altiarchaeota archaeon]
VHKKHKILVVKRKERGALSEGQRRYLRVIKGYRGFPRPSAKVVKQTKKVDIRLECAKCKKKHVKRRTFRTKKFELVR